MLKQYLLLLVIAAHCGMRPTESFSQQQINAIKGKSSFSYDSASLNDYAQKCFEFAEINRDSSFYYAELALTIARKLNQQYYEALLLSIEGYVMTNNGNYANSLRILIEAESIAEDKDVGINILQTPFIKQFIKSDNPARIQALLKGYIKNCLAMLYGQTRNNKRKIAELLQAKEMVEVGKEDYFLLSAINSNIAVAYTEEGKLDSAIYYEFQSVENDKQNHIGLYSGVPFVVIGEAYLSLGQLDSTKKYLFEGLDLIKKQNDNSIALAAAYVSLSKYYSKTGKSDSSLVYARLAILNYKESEEMIPEVADAYEVLSLAYFNVGNADSAYKYVALSKQLNDSLNEKEIINLAAYQNLSYEEQLRLQTLENERALEKSRMRTYFILAALGFLLVIALILYRSNRHKQKTNKLLEATLSNLKAAQSQLIQSEKMASLGELTAGIAHEIQNPLNFVNNFSEVSNELLDEMNEELKNGDIAEAISISSDIKENLQKINHHGKRADAIVKGMLQHSQSNLGQKEPTDINKLVEEYLRLAYHGIRAKNNSFSASLVTDLDDTLTTISIIPQDIGRVMLNLLNNAFYAANEKRKQSPEFEPIVSVVTRKVGDNILIIIKDNGTGIPQSFLDKIFQPFFTTKPTGQGTGLGLSLSYDIVKAHGGSIKVESEEGTGSQFSITLPNKM